MSRSPSLESGPAFARARSASIRSSRARSTNSHPCAALCSFSRRTSSTRLLIASTIARSAAAISSRSSWTSGIDRLAERDGRVGGLAPPPEGEAAADDAAPLEEEDELVEPVDEQGLDA